MIIQPHINTRDDRLLVTLDESLAAVKHQQSVCDNKRWTLKFGGHPVIVKDKVDRITAWINRFKTTGDLVAAVDPIHVGLPWAGIKLLLEASVAEANQMAALLAGCELVLYMANRLKVYVDFLSQVPLGQSQSNLEDQIVQMYACLFEFLAKALRIHQQSSWKRNFQAFWDPSDVTTFDENCKSLGYEVEIEASNAARTLATQDRSNMKKALEDLTQLRSIQVSLQQIGTKIDLGNLRFVKEAPWNAYGQVHQGCHSNTRVQVLQDLQDWACRSDSQHIFWLQGAAGTGKSTISYTLAKWLSEQGASSQVQLGASFFFKRGEGDRGSAALLFPTIAHQLAERLSPFEELLAVAVKEHPDICFKRLGEQYPTLLQGPLSKLPIDTSQKTYVIVIDALDECNLDDIDLALQLWSQTFPPHLRLFVTSRAEPLLKSRFDNISASEHEQLILQDVAEHQVHQDILTFLTTSICQNRERELFKDEPLQDDWPGDDVLEELTKMAVPLFIVAATISRFISDPNQDPVERLEAIISSNRKLGHFSQIARTYLPVLERLESAFGEQQDKIKVYEEFRIIIGSIITLAEPLSIPALAELLEKPIRTLWLRLRSFSSVIQIPPARSDAPVRPLHLSFAEFLTGGEVEGKPFSIDSAVTHGMILDKCIGLLSQEVSRGLYENMCELAYPGHYCQEIPLSKVNACFSPAMQYACRYWTYHAQHSGRRFVDHDAVHEFLRKHFLHWLEALSLLGCMTDSIAHVETLLLLISPHNSIELTAFLEDARRFVLSYRYIINIAPLQVYSSAIIYSPQESIVKSICGRIPWWILQAPIPPQAWGSQLQQLEGHSKSLSGVAFSPCGEVLASAGGDGIRLWAVKTGQELQEFRLGDKRATRLVFSPDGAQLALMLGETILLLDSKTGRELHELDAQRHEVTCMTFSLDGNLLASGSRNGIVRLWDPNTGQQIYAFQEQSHDIDAVAFCLGGFELAWATDGKIWVWHPEQKQKRQILDSEVHYDPVVFSLDGSQLASRSSDGNVRVYSIKTGEARLIGKGVLELAFSLDGAWIALVRYATPIETATLEIWDTRSGEKMQVFESGTIVSTFGWSPDGQQLASVSGEDHLIRLWDAQRRGDKRRLESIKRLDWPADIAFSADGSYLLSLRFHGIVEFWDVSTRQVVKSFEVDEECFYKILDTLRGVGFSASTEKTLFDLLITTDEGTAISLMSFSKTSKKDSDISVVGDWIIVRNHKLLWLPPAWRYGPSLIRDDTIALGQRDGTVSFMRLRYP